MHSFRISTSSRTFRPASKLPQANTQNGSLHALRSLQTNKAKTLGDVGARDTHQLEARGGQLGLAFDQHTGTAVRVAGSEPSREHGCK